MREGQEGEARTPKTVGGNHQRLPALRKVRPVCFHLYPGALLFIAGGGGGGGGEGSWTELKTLPASEGSQAK